MRESLKRNRRRIEHWQVVTLLLLTYDFLAVVLSYFTALWIRFDCKFSSIDSKYLQGFFRTIVIYAVFCVLVFWALRLYKSIWRFASYSELLRVIMATVVTGLVYMTGMTVLGISMPVSYFVFGILMQFCLTLGIRFSYRFVLLLRGRMGYVYSMNSQF